jgi:hypothetical protein
MSKRYGGELFVEEPTTASGTPEQILADHDVIIEIIDSLFDPIYDFQRNLEKIYECNRLAQPLSVGMARAVSGSMFEPIWLALGRPDNGVGVTLHNGSELPSWLVRFETTPTQVRVISYSLINTYYSTLVFMINERLSHRAGELTISELTSGQLIHFINLMNKQLRNG